MGDMERSIAPTADPVELLARTRRAVRKLAEHWEREAQDCEEHLPKQCLMDHEHGDDCELESYVEDSDDVEWDAIGTGYEEHARALRELLARTDLQPPSAT